MSNLSSETEVIEHNVKVIRERLPLRFWLATTWAFTLYFLLRFERGEVSWLVVLLILTLDWVASFWALGALPFFGGGRTRSIERVETTTTVSYYDVED